MNPLSDTQRIDLRNKVCDAVKDGLKELGYEGHDAKFDRWQDGKLTWIPMGWINLFSKDILEQGYEDPWAKFTPSVGASGNVAIHVDFEPDADNARSNEWDITLDEKQVGAMMTADREQARKIVQDDIVAVLAAGKFPAPPGTEA